MNKKHLAIAAAACLAVISFTMPVTTYGDA